jgi:hypothetical protein
VVLASRSAKIVNEIEPGRSYRRAGVQVIDNSLSEGVMADKKIRGRLADRILQTLTPRYGTNSPKTQRKPRGAVASR